MKIRFHFNAVVLLAAMAISAQANLVQNGDFSDGLNGWTVTGFPNPYNYSGPGVTAAGGADFEGNGLWMLSQSLNVTPGAEYAIYLTVLCSTHTGPEPYIPPVTIAFGDFSMQFNLTGNWNPSGISGGMTNSWVMSYPTYEVTATSSEMSSLLSFTTTEDSSSWNFTLTDVRVEAVPDATATGGLLILGLGGVVMARRAMVRSASR